MTGFWEMTHRRRPFNAEKKRKSFAQYSELFSRRLGQDRNEKPVSAEPKPAPAKEAKPVQPAKQKPIKVNVEVVKVETEPQPSRWERFKRWFWTH